MSAKTFPRKYAGGEEPTAASRTNTSFSLPKVLILGGIVMAPVNSVVGREGCGVDNRAVRSKGKSNSNINSAWSKDDCR